MICLNIFLEIALYLTGIVYLIYVITSNSAGIFENRPDKFCRDQACYFDYTANLNGAGNRSQM